MICVCVCANQSVALVPAVLVLAGFGVLLAAEELDDAVLDDGVDAELPVELAVDAVDALEPGAVVTWVVLSV